MNDINLEIGYKVEFYHSKSHRYMHGYIKAISRRWFFFREYAVLVLKDNEIHLVSPKQILGKLERKEKININTDK